MFRPTIRQGLFANFQIRQLVNILDGDPPTAQIYTIPKTFPGSFEAVLLKNLIRLFRLIRNVDASISRGMRLSGGCTTSYATSYAHHSSRPLD